MYYLSFIPLVSRSPWLKLKTLPERRDAIMALLNHLVPVRNPPLPVEISSEEARRMAMMKAAGILNINPEINIDSEFKMNVGEVEEEMLGNVWNSDDENEDEEVLDEDEDIQGIHNVFSYMLC